MLLRESISLARVAVYRIFPAGESHETFAGDGGGGCTRPQTDHWSAVVCFLVLALRCAYDCAITGEDAPAVDHKRRPGHGGVPGGNARRLPAAAREEEDGIGSALDLLVDDEFERSDCYRVHVHVVVNITFIPQLGWG